MSRSRMGHRPLVRATLAWYRLITDKTSSEKVRGEAFRAVLDLCKRIEEG